MNIEKPVATEAEKTKPKNTLQSKKERAEEHMVQKII